MGTVSGLLPWRKLATQARVQATCTGQPPARTHLTMWLLSLSICSSDTSRSVVDGTPSSSICGRQGAPGDTGASSGAEEEPWLAWPCGRQEQEGRSVPPLAHTYLEPALFQCHQLARVHVLRLVHLAISALPDLLQLFILVHSAAGAAASAAWGSPRGRGGVCAGGAGAGGGGERRKIGRERG